MAVMANIDELADAICEAAAETGGNSKEAWRKAIRMLAEHIVKNAEVQGIAPPGGGKITEGKIL